MKKDGIYFGLSEEEYFNEPRIGSTLLRCLIDSPVRFWFDSFLNPIKKAPQEKKNLNCGKIFHKLLLEGEKALHADFAIAPATLHSASGMYKKWKDAQIRPIVKETDVRDARRVLAYLTGKGQVLDNFFKGGYPEVSILWTDSNGLKRAARIDYLKIGQFIDVKSFEDWKDDKEHYKRYFWKYKVFVQLIDYLNAIKAGRDLPVVKGTPKQKAFWAECTKINDWLPWICFVDRENPRYSLKTFNPAKCPDVYRAGRAMIKQAYDNFEKYYKRFGLTNAWIDEPNPDDLEFVDADFANELMQYEI